MTQQDEPLMSAGEATEYLKKKWGKASYSTDAFKRLRLTRGIEADFSASNGTFWRKSTLDRIEKPKKGKRKKIGDSEEGSRKDNSGYLGLNTSYALAV
jgi:hypothetical protein